MRTKIQKWGNSLALRIPKAFAEEAGLHSETSVEIRMVDGQIHIIPTQEIRYELDALLADITTDKLHDEVETGDSAGNEAW